MPPASTVDVHNIGLVFFIYTYLSIVTSRPRRRRLNIVRQEFGMDFDEKNLKRTSWLRFC